MEGEENTKFLISMQVINPRPRVLRTSRNQSTRVAIHRSTGDVIPEIDLFEHTTGTDTIEQIDRLPRGYSQNTRVVLSECQTVQFAATDRAVDGVFKDRVARAKVPPADLAVFGGCREDVVVVVVPDNGFDCTIVDAGTDFIARYWVVVGRRGGSRRKGRG